MTIAQYFQTLTGFPPRQFQLNAIAHLLNRQDVLLCAPTGSGKTETAIASSWRSIARFLPRTLSLQPVNLSKELYALTKEEE